MKRILIIGYGLSGKAAERLAHALGYETEIVTGGGITSGSFAVVSPGVPMTSPLIAECRERGIPLKSEMQFGCEELKRRGWRLVAVTGSKGKSSVVKLLAEALGGVACGNYGLPVSEVAATASLQPQAVAVVEVSSFMMETTDLPRDFFDAAAVLNLQEDHLDRHGSVEVYHSLKMKLLDFARVKVKPDAGDEGVAEALQLLRGSYFDNEILRANALAAIAVMRAMGLGDDSIAAAFASFKPLPHRFMLVDTVDGVKYIDDSKATSIAALIAGVKMAADSGRSKTANVRLIAGGLAKGDDPRAALPDLTDWVKKVYIIGCCAEKLFAAWSGSVDCEVCGTLENAVSSAMRDARSGESVVLSPGCASFDQFKSFEERGDLFADFVKKGKNKR